MRVGVVITDGFGNRGSELHYIGVPVGVAGAACVHDLCVALLAQEPVHKMVESHDPMDIYVFDTVEHLLSHCLLKRDCVLVENHIYYVVPMIYLTSDYRAEWDEISSEPWQNDATSRVWRFPKAAFAPYEPTYTGIAFIRRQVYDNVMEGLLIRDVLDGGKIGWVRGPIGSGRSMLAAAFIRGHAVQQGWTVTWLNVWI